MTTFTVPEDVAERAQMDADHRAALALEQQARRELSVELRRLRGTSTPPVPDPSRTAAALRERARQEEQP